jgi:DNA-binding response OmpR family regulator
VSAPRILVVEDDPAIACAIEDDLRLEGYEVVLATDGPSAIQRGKAERFDLILLDVMLPGQDGFEVCRALRSAGTDAYILMVTARGGEAERVLGLDLGADDYLTKPYSPKELRARIRARLRRRSAPTDRVISFGECELDLRRAELRRRGRPVATTPLELKLLGILATQPGRALTRRLLIDAAWGPATSITERVVDNQIAHLRQKIEPSPASPRFLKSVRGLGYRFDFDDVSEP